MLEIHRMPDEIRTHNLSLRRRILYPIELQAHMSRQRDLNPQPSDYKSDALPVKAISAFYDFDILLYRVVLFLPRQNA